MSKMWKLWAIRIYNSYFKPVLTYYSGTWGITNTKMKGLESFHRRQLRVLGTTTQSISPMLQYTLEVTAVLYVMITPSMLAMLGRILCSDPEKQKSRKSILRPRY